MRRARWPAAARCPEGYHTKRQYGTTWPKSQQDCGLAVRVIFRQGKESPLFEGQENETEGASEHSGFFHEEGCAALAGRARPQTEATGSAGCSRREAALDEQEIGTERRMNFRLGLIFGVVFALILILINRTRTR